MGNTNMDEKNDLIKVGKYDLRYNELLSINYRGVRHI